MGGGEGGVGGGLLVRRVPGYKVFRLTSSLEPPGLRAQYIDRVWLSGEATARCEERGLLWAQFTLPEPHESPDSRCYCGLHAYYDGARAAEAFQPGQVVALVGAAGKIVPHDDGFRAARMRVEAVWDPMRRQRGEVAAKRHDAKIVRSLAGLEQLERTVGERLPGR